MFDPMAAGADCKACILRTMRDGSPVASEIPDRPQFAIVGEAPGEEEEREGRPFVGPSGQMLTRELAPHGVYREQIAFINVLACRPPSNKLDQVAKELSKRNKERKKLKLALLPSPQECCRNRFNADLRKVAEKRSTRSLNILPVGKVACAALKIENSISDVRGSPIVTTAAMTLRGEKKSVELHILPTYHPAHVLRRPSEIFAFQADLGRAVRWFRDGHLGWVQPAMLIQPTLEQARKWWTSVRGTRVAFDVETVAQEGFRPEHAKDPLYARLRCWGFFSDKYGAMVVPWLSIDGRSTFYTEADRIGFVQLFAEIMGDPQTLKVSWNGGYYDQLVIQNQFPGMGFKNHLDLILAHRGVQSEVSHKLGYVGSIFTDVPPWKAARAALNAETDHELHVYNATDCAVTDKLVKPLWSRVIERKQQAAVLAHHKVQEMCRGLHIAGLRVDQKRRREHDVAQRQIAVMMLKRLREASGIPDLNPQSIPQLRTLLFDTWNFPAPHYTKGGDPSTDDESIRALLLENAWQGPSKPEIVFLDALRRFRKSVKLRGTYLRKFIPWDMPIMPDDLEDDDEFTEEERDQLGDLVKDEDAVESIKKKRKKVKRWGIVMPDGRIHPNYNAHTPSNQRIASSDPNAQNIPRKIRDLFIPEDGRVFIYADKDQLELRFAAAIWGLSAYLEVFAKGTDPHDLSAVLIFGDFYRNHPTTTKDEIEAKERLRDFAKRFTYAVIYGAEVETIHDVIVSAEDGNGNLPYARNQLKSTEEAYEAWMRNVPEIRRGWDSEIATFQRQGYIREPVFGFRRDFTNAGGEKDITSEILNFRCSAGGAGVVHTDTQAVLESIPFCKWGKSSGLVNQTHDSLTGEVPCTCTPTEGKNKKGKPIKIHASKCTAEEARRTLGECMTRRVKDIDTGIELPVTFSADAKIMERWA